MSGAGKRLCCRNRTSFPCGHHLYFGFGPSYDDASPFLSLCFYYDFSFPETCNLRLWSFLDVVRCENVFRHTGQLHYVLREERGTVTVEALDEEEC